MPSILVLLLLMHLIMPEEVMCRREVRDRTGLQTRQECRYPVWQVSCRFQDAETERNGSRSRLLNDLCPD